ncbi:hypothetical protein BU17DRAFT_93121 [Hysterangium stoloniferum]|nr:hypothetical protein BU17DRAFT_93121 [Hysterangium stoloniferum]
MFSLTFTVVIATLFVSAPDVGAKPSTLKNGQDAIALNSLPCPQAPLAPDGDLTCINGKFAQCSGGKFLLTSCAVGTICVALPLVNKPGTVCLHPFDFLVTMDTDTRFLKQSITCDTAADRDD